MKEKNSSYNDPAQSSVSTSVLARAQNGDEDAFRVIASLYTGLVYYWCRKTGLQPADAEDVGQQVFVTASRNLVRFSRDKSGGSFRGWLRMITRSRIADHFRQSSKREVVSGQAQWDDSSILAIADDNVDALLSREEIAVLYHQAIRMMEGRFAESDCKAFLMHVVEGVAAKEVAEKLGITVNSVYIAKSRIRKQLREAFAELLDDELTI